MSSKELRLYIALYFDEDVALPIAAALRKHKYDVVTAHSVGMLTQSDRANLEYASSEERAVVTHNRDDFLDLHDEWIESGKTHYGIIVLVRRKTFRAMTERLLRLLDDVTADEMENQLRFI